MSVTNCALSGESLVNPVVSIKSGHVFEKALIEQHLANTGQCPLTGVDLNAQTDLITLQVANACKPKPLVANSVPGVLQMLQMEWDTAMLDVYNLRKALGDSRKELAHALYQHDAACRVIARLVKEKEKATQMLSLTQEELNQCKGQLVQSQIVEQELNDKLAENVGKEDELFPATLAQRMVDQSQIL